ncbi:serine/threonine protein kinase [Pseudenhygromyxa sp. WMMC2535]|uniref:serine/threonine-protein kinase n=1 Tax=Pseudenhygromyxa sp. WMMC2535 TaxID=2712867 RepID=UPI00155378C4|nr:serine/threonine-protein kinase [Pseudenhygromyxa sp. WMMC2535]NVB39949.1 serine/threonine protein kinase [Pseudenhygromyxa sp. WMMC2535]
MVRVGQRLGKYRLKRRVARGGFGDVYEAYDTIEGISVALKIPLGGSVKPEQLDDFRREVRITAKLEHPNILPIKNADFLGDVFAIVQPLGEQSLDDRMSKRMTLERRLDYIDQMLAGLAHAHERGIIHCDIKPDNMILFPEGRLRLADFGIAKFARKTINASASGSVGYMAPEQAMGKPSARSDVFSAGLVIHQLLTGKLPQWPFEWPTEGKERLKVLHPDLREFVRRALEVETRKRFRDAVAMYRAFKPVKRKALRYATERRTKKS